MHILIIEDEPKAAAYLKKGLTESGFIVDVATNGEDGLFSATNSEYDMAIVDIMLPKLDGWAVIEGIRRNNNNMIILALTARDDIQDKVKGLDLGADDYLVKPFAFSELLARIRSLLRRGQTFQSETLQIADLKINLIQHKATRSNVRLNLTAKEFNLLALMARRKGEVLSRTLIAEQVWDINFDSDTNIIDVAVRRLRQKIDDPFTLKLIHTIRGIGYVLEEK